MHYLHKILVYIPDAVTDRDNYERSELIDAIRTHAENTTEEFYQSVFDWRETDSAGSWSDEYPENVLLAQDDVDQFIRELFGARNSQFDEIQYSLEQLENTVGTDLKHIAEHIIQKRKYLEEADGFSVMTPYYLHCVAALLHGEYRSNSYFYNTHDYTAFLYPEDINAIKKSPADWALVMFDYHN